MSLNFLLTLFLLQSTLPSPASSSLAGTIIDVNGVDASFASIQLVKQDSPGQDSFQGRMSNEKSKFEFDKLEPGQYRVYIWKKEAGVPVTRGTILSPPTPIPIITLTPGQHLDQIVFSLPKPYGLIRGIILDAASHAVILSAQLRAVRSDDPGAYLETSLRNGGFELRFPEHSTKLTITAPGYAPWEYKSSDGKTSFTLKSTDEITLNIEMERVSLSR